MRKCWLVMLTLAMLFLLVHSPYAIAAEADIPSDLSTGPYVDKIVYKVIDDIDERILALVTGEIEMDSDFKLSHYGSFGDDPINIFAAPKNGYEQITINCRDAPLNETVLRRAFAFAFDKTRVTAEIMDGWSQEQDSLVPYVNGWCIEDQLTPHYYTAQVTTGNALLDTSGIFAINPSTGYREYKGQPFDIAIEYDSTSAEIEGGIAQIGVDALLALHINASIRSSGFNEFIARLDAHDDYDMIVYNLSFPNNDVDWLAYEYWSEYADTPYQNPTNFKNATFNSCRDQLLYGTTYEEVYNASSWMQKILHEQVPKLVVSENTYIQAYRIDKFTGHIVDLGRGIAGSWTVRKIHKLDGSGGGTVSIAIGGAPDSFNIFLASSPYAEVILSELWPSLYSYGPDLKPWPYLAEHLTTEYDADNPDVPAGHTRYTVDIIQNATWSDGEPLTAYDVAFTFTYILESGIYGNPAATEIGPLVAAYALSDHRVVIEYNTESYWHFSDFAFEFIIPQYIFNNETGIGYNGWNDWNPVFDPASPNVNCGPFILTDFEVGDFYELSVNEGFAYLPSLVPPDTTITTTTVTTRPIDPSIAIASTIIAGGSIIVILTMVIQIARYKKTERPLGPSLH